MSYYSIVILDLKLCFSAMPFNVMSVATENGNDIRSIGSIGLLIESVPPFQSPCLFSPISESKSTLSLTILSDLKKYFNHLNFPMPRS